MLMGTGNLLDVIISGSNLPAGTVVPTQAVPSTTQAQPARSPFDPTPATHIAVATPVATVSTAPAQPAPVTTAAETIAQHETELVYNGFAPNASGQYVLPAAVIAAQAALGVTAQLVAAAFALGGQGMYGTWANAGFTATVDAAGDVVVSPPGLTVATTYPLGLTGTEWLLIAGAAAVLIYFLMSKKGGRP